MTSHREDWGALLIGTSRSETDLADIDAVLNNLVDVRKALIAEELVGMPRANVVVVAEPESPGQILEPLDRLAVSMTGVLFVYFAGHGLLDDGGNLYLGLVTSSRHNLKWNAVKASDVRDSLRHASARTRILMLDCCFSGRALEAMAPAESIIAGTLDVDGFVTIASAPPNVAALAPIGAEYTAFTGEILRTIRYGDKESDREYLDLDSIFRRARNRLVLQDFPRPQILNQDDAHHILFTRNAARDRRTAQQFVDLFVAAGVDVEHGRFVEAIEKLDRILREDPQYPGAGDLRGVAQRRKQFVDLFVAAGVDVEHGRFVEAIEKLDRILREDPQYPGAGDLRGVALRRKQFVDLFVAAGVDVEHGRFVEAIEKLDRILRDDPQYPGAGDLRAVAQRHQPSVAQPDHQLVDLFVAAGVDVEHGRFVEAIEKLDRILRDDPQYPGAGDLRAVAQRRKQTVAQRHRQLEKLWGILVFAATGSVVIGLFLPWQVDYYMKSGSVDHEVPVTLVGFSQTNWEFGRVGPTLLLAAVAGLTVGLVLLGRGVHIVRWRPVAGGLTCAAAFLMGWQAVWQSWESRNTASRISDLKLGFFFYAAGAVMLVVAATVAVAVPGPRQPRFTLRPRYLLMAAVLVLGGVALHFVQFARLDHAAWRLDYWQMVSVVAISIMVLAAGKHLVHRRTFLLSAFAALGGGAAMISIGMLLYGLNDVSPFRLYAADMQIVAAAAIWLAFVRPVRQRHQ
ncbi:caspase family protein [Kribbella qitaiheensis]|uniref:caspase, EACC1-associated type n=1 Tax=Kribbella qitaiheensis TaxID=1544730 RepID=UPI0036164924